MVESVALSTQLPKLKCLSISDIFFFFSIKNLTIDAALQWNQSPLITSSAGWWSWSATMNYYHNIRGWEDNSFFLRSDISVFIIIETQKNLKNKDVLDHDGMYPGKFGPLGLTVHFWGAFSLAPDIGVGLSAWVVSIYIGDFAQMY